MSFVVSEYKPEHTLAKIHRYIGSITKTVFRTLAQTVATTVANAILVSWKITKINLQSPRHKADHLT